MTGEEFATVESTSLGDRIAARWRAWLVAAVATIGLVFFLTHAGVGGMARVSYIGHFAGITVAALWYGLRNVTPTPY